MSEQSYQCAMCGKRLVPGFAELDHKVPVEDGGSVWDPTNLQVLHPECHGKKTALENRERNAKRARTPKQAEWDDLLETENQLEEIAS